MHYSSFSLNGTWEMAYSETVYAGTEEPVFSGFPIEHAVPGYWEDMIDLFAYAPFYGSLKINPEYGTQRYPIADTAPDMALPTVLGNFFYRRSFLCESIDAPAALYFTGVQNAVSAWLNGIYIGRHEGYSTSFELPVSGDALKIGENTLVLSVSNIGLTGFDAEDVSGLTNRAACQYTGGITGDVELRVYESPLRDMYVLVSEDCSRIIAHVETDGAAAFSWSVYDGAKCLLQGTAEGDFSFDTQELQRWSPESPKLYTLELRCGDAILRHSFGVRRLSADGVGLRLNGVPYYLRGACEHCYYPLTVHPNHDLSYYRTVVRKLKELGFNFIRFHTHIPTEEYMQAADELGMLMQVESPNYASVEEYRQIVRFCRRHTSVVIYCCGNELEMDEPFIDYLQQCASAVHAGTDALYSPMSALRGVEYFWQRDVKDDHVVMTPFRRHPVRQEKLNTFCDLYNSYTLALNSYSSLSANPEKVDSWSVLYNKPRLSHETCIQGTYTDLSLASRYEGTLVGKTDMFDSLRRHLSAKGILHKAPLFFRNSSEWQRRLRKHCFEATRLSKNLAGYDFLGPIDTHWHTFGYDVGMMNEFYELKPGETLRNVRMYNAPTVLLTDLGTDMVFTAGKEMNVGIHVSHFGAQRLCDAALNLRLSMDGKLLACQKITVSAVECGSVEKLYDLRVQLPDVENPGAMRLYATLECGDTYAENEWELYLFPEVTADPGNLVVADTMDEETLKAALKAGSDVLLLSSGPFVSLPTSFQIALAGRTSGNLATVITDHPAMAGMPHDGFCGWQFRRLLEGGSAVSFNDLSVPFDPIIEVASSHKYAIRQGILFEYNVLGGRLLVCGFRFDDHNPAAKWLKAQLIRYARSEDFDPTHTLSEEQFHSLIHGKLQKAAANSNLAFNPNDKAAKRKNKK